MIKMAFTVATANKILNKILKGTDFTPPATMYLSLHTATPGDTGANEVAKGSSDYVRKAITFGTVANKACDNSAAIEFTNMPAADITHIGLWDAATAGSFWWGGQLSGGVTKSVAAGDTFRVNANDLDVTLT
jgi:hypothetical protein